MQVFKYIPENLTGCALKAFFKILSNKSFNMFVGVKINVISVVRYVHR
jgi:hypothetical protein